MSGAPNLLFMGTPITNAYRNLTNIILRVSPKRALAQPAVLINAHFDSSFGSPGKTSTLRCVDFAGHVTQNSILVVIPWRCCSDLCGQLETALIAIRSSSTKRPGSLGTVITRHLRRCFWH